MEVAFQIASIILSIVLIILIMLQVRGGSIDGLLGGGGAGGGIARTRRGLEKTLFQITVGLSTIFLIICIIAVIVYN